MNSVKALVLAMGIVKVDVDDEVEKTFRKAAMQRFGYGRGSLSEAAEHALKDWSKRQADYTDDIENPVKIIKGILKHVKKTSVELQHDASKIRAERWEKHAHNRR